jgi:fatty-acyl-CoA synthase
VTKSVKDKQLEELELSSVRVAGCGAEPIRAATLKEFAQKFAPAGFRSTAFLPSYGMAESTLAITFHPVGTEMVVDVVDAEAMKDGVARPANSATKTPLEVVSCGVGFPEHEVRVVDDQGQPLPERRVGQVIARGPSVTEGYFENAEATAESLKDGWLQTGDLGYVADGNLYICGRLKDLIIIRGANHYPQDLEWSVGDLEGVRRGNVVAFSVMRDGTEELVIAAEANRADAERLRTEIARKIQQEFGLSPAHVAICAVGALPKTSSGKAQRRKTKALFEAGDLGEHA